MKRECKTCISWEPDLGLDGAPMHCWSCVNGRNKPYWKCKPNPSRSTPLPQCTCNEKGCPYPHTGEDDY